MFFFLGESVKEKGKKYKDVFIFLYALVKLLILSTHLMKYIWYSPLFFSSFLFLINVLFLLFSKSYVFISLILVLSYLYC